MDEMYSACMTEVDKYLKEDLTESFEFVHWKKQVKNKTPSGKYTTKKLRKIVVIRKSLMPAE